MRTRSPCRTIKGVVAGAALPLRVSQLNSMFIGVGNGDIGQNGVFLQNDCEISIYSRPVRLLGMHDEGADHAHHFLHRHVRVVKVGTFLVKCEFIDESPARRDRVLATPRRSVHLDRHLESMPVHRCRFGEVVVDDDANAIALIHLNRWSGSAAVIAPQVGYTPRNNLLFHGFGDQVEFLYASVHAPRELRNIGRFHTNDRTAAALGSMAHVSHVLVCSTFLRGCKQARRSCENRAETERISKEITSALHGSSSSTVGRTQSSQGTSAGLWIEARCVAPAIDIKSLPVRKLLEEEGKTQMRRMP